MVTTKRLTAQDLWSLGSDGERFELIEGELVEVTPPNFEHGEIQVTILGILNQFVRHHKLGKVVTESGFIISLDPDTVLGPDVSFVSRERLPENPRRFAEIPPDLVAEVVSPSDSRAKIERRIDVFLRGGVRCVWIIYPDRRQIVVHQRGAAAQTLSEGDLLEGGDILPGFTVAVADILEE